MRNLSISLALLLILSVVSCSPKYTHSSIDESRWKNDYAMCVTEADYQVDFHPYTTDAAHPYDTRLLTYSDRYWGIVNSCMADKGYEKVDEKTWMDSVKEAVQYN